MSTLNMRIERFLSETAMAATLFGRQAANDPRLVGDMRRGRKIRAPLRARIEAFIEEHRA